MNHKEIVKLLLENNCDPLAAINKGDILFLSQRSGSELYLSNNSAICA
jgi:hypothetical protein